MTPLVQLVELKPRYLSDLMAIVLSTAVIVSKKIADNNFGRKKLSYFFRGEFFSEYAIFFLPYPARTLKSKYREGV
jgi:hypothetical protein